MAAARVRNRLRRVARVVRRLAWLAAPARLVLTASVLAIGTAGGPARAIPSAPLASPAPPPGPSVPFAPAGEDWQGLSQFVRAAAVEAGSARVVVTSTLDLRGLEPSDAVVIVHPTATLDGEDLSAFMHAGGRVLLLDDFGTGDELLALFHIRRRALPSRPAAMLRDNPALAIAEPGSDHAAVRGVTHVVTNHATGLENPALSPILVVHGQGEDDVVLGLAGAVERGRFLAIGDGSVLINAMMRYPGNRTLALDLVRYGLEEEPWGRHGGKLYVVANDFQTTGSYGNDSPFWSAVNDARRGFQTLRRDGMPSVIAYLVAVVVAIGVIVWTGARAGKTHKLAPPRFTRAVPVVAQGGIAGHAATLGAPGASRALAILELKSALEEELATRLGLQNAPPPDQLVARLRSMRLLDEAGGRALLQVFASMTAVQKRFARFGRRGMTPTRQRDAATDADVLRLAAAVRDLRGRLGLVPSPARPAARGRDIVQEPP